jgi:hypothetical protein
VIVVIVVRAPCGAARGGVEEVEHGGILARAGRFRKVERHKSTPARGASVELARGRARNQP